ncbi:MAG: hypothetical protein JRN45_10700 [Nitrososphaerota archaeon]|nr:hypothetical protein [Nitrososphaerota archaeon]
MEAPKKTQYWFAMDQSYNSIVYTMPSVEGVVYERGAQMSRQGLTFTIDNPDVEGVKFQLTRKDKLGIFAPEGVDLETIVGIIKPYLDTAAGKPVRLTPLLMPSTAASKAENDTELVGNTRLAVALGRCYDLLFDLNYLISRTFKSSLDEDARRVKERLVVVRSLLLKYNPALKRSELEHEERKTFPISLMDLLSGGFWWGKRFIKRGLKGRYAHLLSLAKELPEGQARDEIFTSLSLFAEVAAKLDQQLRSLEPPSSIQKELASPSAP